MSNKPDVTMFKPSLRDPKTLIVLAIISIVAIFFAERSHRMVQLPDYELKMDAANRMKAALGELRQFRFGAGQNWDYINDPNTSAMIGRQESQITTEDGKLEAALTAINPNVAAAVVSYLREAKIQAGDPVAVTLSGTYPGMNLATMCALEAIGAKAVVITSLGSAQWGANDPAFTWLDMESILLKSGKLHTKTVLASLGGGGDYGRGLSDRGRQLLREAIARNNVEKLEVTTLDSAIVARMQRFERELGGKPKLFIAVGGGAAAIGHSENTWLLPTGYMANLPSRNYPNIGVIHFYAEAGIPVIHLYDITKIATDFELPKAPVPLPAPGNGGVYATKRYDVRVAALVFAIFLIVFGYVVNADRKKYRLKEEGADPDTLPISK